MSPRVKRKERRRNYRQEESYLNGLTAGEVQVLLPYHNSDDFRRR